MRATPGSGKMGSIELSNYRRLYGTSRSSTRIPRSDQGARGEQHLGSCSDSTVLALRESILLPECRAIPFRKLVEPELLSRTIEAIVDGEKACPFPEVLWFRLDRPETGNVVIHTMGTTKEIPDSGEFFGVPLSLSSDLMAENPLVVFPGTSRRVCYVEGCGIPNARLSGRISKF